MCHEKTHGKGGGDKNKEVRVWDTIYKVYVENVLKLTYKHL